VGGLRASHDGGRTWAGMNWTVPANDFPGGIAVDSHDPATVYVGTARGSIFKTANGGASWSLIR